MTYYVIRDLKVGDRVAVVAPIAVLGDDWTQQGDLTKMFRAPKAVFSAGHEFNVLRFIGALEVALVDDAGRQATGYVSLLAKVA